MGWWIIPLAQIVLLQSLAAVVLAYEVMDVHDGGMIVGRVTFAGTIPSLPSLSLVKDQELCAAAASPQMLLISKENKGVMTR